MDHPIDAISDQELRDFRGLIDCGLVKRQLAPAKAPNPADRLCGVILIGIAFLIDRELAHRAEPKLPSAKND